MKRSELNAALANVAAAYMKAIDSMVGKSPGSFSKRQAEDLKAGFGDGLAQGARTALKTAGVTIEEA